MAWAVLGANPLLSGTHHRHRLTAVNCTAIYTPSMASSIATTTTTTKWAQKTITLSPHPRGCHLITPKVLKEIGQDLSDFKCGLAHLFLQHTSASLTINENYDTDVRKDTETFLNRVVPEGSSAPWKHTLEGPDDMPAHIKSSMFGCALTIPISNGKLNMGTWQVYHKYDNEYCSFFVDNFDIARDLYLYFVLGHGQNFGYHDLFQIGNMVVRAS